MPTVARIASGAVSTPTSHPPIPGPAMFASSYVACSLPFASAICDGRTSDGTMLWYDTSKKTVAMPTTRATAYTCHICSAPSHHRSGRAPSATARTASAQIITCRLRIRSIQAPAGSPTTRNAATPAALSTPTCSSLASSSRTASTGIASSWIWDPNWLKAWPLQIVRKLRSRHSDRATHPALVRRGGCSPDAVVVGRLGDRPRQPAGPGCLGPRFGDQLFVRGIRII